MFLTCPPYPYLLAFYSHHFSSSSIMFSKTSLVAAAMGLFLATTGKCAG